MTSGHWDKQIQVYDPAVARKQVAAQGNAGEGDRNVGSKSASRNPPAEQGAILAGGGRHSNAARRYQQATRYAAQ
jgi:hypothetical protein